MKQHISNITITVVHMDALGNTSHTEEHEWEGDADEPAALRPAQIYDAINTILEYVSADNIIQPPTHQEPRTKKE